MFIVGHEKGIQMVVRKTKGVLNDLMKDVEGGGFLNVNITVDGGLSLNPNTEAVNFHGKSLNKMTVQDSNRIHGRVKTAMLNWQSRALSEAGVSFGERASDANVHPLP
jgi:hypothetical protein